MIFVGSGLNNISYGILLPTMRDVTEQNIEPQLRNLGHNLSDAIYTSLSGMVSLLYAGAIVDSFGVSFMLFICIIIISFSVIINLRNHRS